LKATRTGHQRGAVRSLMYIHHRGYPRRWIVCQTASTEHDEGVVNRAQQMLSNTQVVMLGRLFPNQRNKQQRRSVPIWFGPRTSSLDFSHYLH
jgi:hypothetical protein